MCLLSSDFRWWIWFLVCLFCEMGCTSISCTVFVWIPKKKPTANRKSEICSPTRACSPRLNRRESRKPLACSQNRICCSSLELGGHLASLSTCSAKVVRFQRPTRYRHAGSSLIGSVRANPVGAPAPPIGNSSLRLILRLPEKNVFQIY